MATFLLTVCSLCQIVGGGAAGVIAFRELRQLLRVVNVASAAAEASSSDSQRDLPAVDVRVLEAGPRLGGVWAQSTSLVSRSWCLSCVCVCALLLYSNHLILCV